MTPSILNTPDPRHLERLDIPRKQAKADLQKVETQWPEMVGLAIQRCFSLAGVTQKQAAAALEKATNGRVGDAAQVGRWLSGKERPQLDALFAVEEFRQPLVIAFAELAGQAVEVETVVRVRRTA
jgi:hypothetical protein